LLHRLTGTINPMLASDMAMAAILAEAGARSAACNVQINLPLLDEELVRTTFEKTIATTLADARRIAEKVQDSAATRATGG
jgi:formiminotetrahydrofolate cyclodeaminase